MFSNPLVVAAILVLGVAAGRWFYKKDTEKEDRKRAANRLAGLLRSKGMAHIPEFLEDYGVDDWSGMAKKIKQAAALIENPKHAEELFDAVVDKALLLRAAVAEKKDA